MFDSPGIVFHIVNDSPPQESPVKHIGQRALMDSVCRQALRFLPEPCLNRFKSFGQQVAQNKSAISVVSLCSGTDGQIDALKEKLTNN